jgi:hypothetical protein
MKKKIKKSMKNRLFVVGMGLIAMSAFAFGFSNADLLKGRVNTPEDPEISLDPQYDFSDEIVLDIFGGLNEFTAKQAKMYSEQAQEFAEEAQECVDDLDQYYGWSKVNKCSDTDGGVDYETKGTINGTSWYDGSSVKDQEEYCSDSNTLVEYWCIDDANSIFDGLIAGDSYSCKNGYSCSDGACIPDVVIDEPTVPYSCEDSDDGIDYYSQSTVSGTSHDDESRVSNKQEYCEDEDTLIEYWCPESGEYAEYLYSESFECPDEYTCDDGACISRDDILRSRDYDCEEPFRDTNDEMVCRAYKAGIVNGKTYTSFDPYAGITRAEVIKLIILTMGEEPLNRNQGVLDMNSGHWAWGYVNRAKDLDIITESTFNPDVEVSRGTTMVWLVRAAEQTLDRDEWEDRIPWSDMTVYNPVTYAAMIGNDEMVEFLDGDEEPVVEGYSDNTFRPENNIMRYEAVYLVYRSYLAWFADEDTFVDPDED